MKRRIIPSFLAVVLLAGFVACGEDSTENGGQTASAADFCEEHQIAESQCVFCDSSLIESLGFCRGHGVPEAFCYQCNPALNAAFQAVGDWCGGHDRPESQCYICNPELDPFREGGAGQGVTGFTTPPEIASPLTSSPDGYVSRTHRPPDVYCSKQALTIRFESRDIATEAGLQYARVESRPISKSIECNAEVVFDGNRYAHVASQMPGVVAAVHKDFGEVVEMGEPLVTITSAHLGAAKATYLQAVAATALRERNHARESNLFERGASTEKQLLESETDLLESRISLSESEHTLQSFGLTPRQITNIEQGNDTSAQYVVRAPFAGIIIDRHATVGEVVNPAKPLFVVADISRMWALIDVYESDLRHIGPGQPVMLQVQGLPGETFAGEITWVSSQLDPDTRTLKARAEFDNTAGLLRANMFAEAAITVRDHQPSLVVPTSSVQWEGCCNVVFVKQSESVYEPRKVHLGIATGTVYEVLSGVREDEEVVTQGSFLLKTEILKGSIGAGCCEVDPGA